MNEFIRLAEERAAFYMAGITNWAPQDLSM